MVDDGGVGDRGREVGDERVDHGEARSENHDHGDWIVGRWGGDVFCERAGELVDETADCGWGEGEVAELCEELRRFGVGDLSDVLGERHYDGDLFDGKQKQKKKRKEKRGKGI